MSEPTLHVLNPKAGQNRLLPDLHAVPQPHNLRIDGFDFLVLFAQLAADFLLGLTVPHVPLVEGLNALEDRLAFFSRFIGLPAFFFNLVLELLERPSLFIDFIVDGIGKGAGRHRARCEEQHGHPTNGTPSHTLTSSNRLRETKLPANPRTMPTPTSSRHMDKGKNIVNCSRPRSRP